MISHDGAFISSGSRHYFTLALTGTTDPRSACREVEALFGAALRLQAAPRDGAAPPQGGREMPEDKPKAAQRHPRGPKTAPRDPSRSQEAQEAPKERALQPGRWKVENKEKQPDVAAWCFVASGSVLLKMASGRPRKVTR